MSGVNPNQATVDTAYLLGPGRQSPQEVEDSVAMLERDGIVKRGKPDGA